MTISLQKRLTPNTPNMLPSFMQCTNKNNGRASLLTFNVGIHDAIHHSTIIQLKDLHIPIANIQTYMHTLIALPLKTLLTLFLINENSTNNKPMFSLHKTIFSLLLFSSTLKIGPCIYLLKVGIRPLVVPLDLKSKHDSWLVGLLSCKKASVIRVLLSLMEL